MTSSEVLPSGKKMGTESINRKASFKFSSGNKSTGANKITRKVVVPISTVQALTFKFNELSQIGDGQKRQKLSESAVRNILTGNGKTGTIKVVICRKPSNAKHKKSEEVIARKKLNLRRMRSNDSFPPAENDENSNPGIDEKISAFEEMEKAENDSNDVVNGKSERNSEMDASKIWFDVSESRDENRSIGNDEKENPRENDSKGSENFFSVRTAISLFEQNFGGGNAVKSNAGNRAKSLEFGKCTECRFDSTETSNEPEMAKRFENADDNKPETMRNVKAKPIAAIKPILKKPDEKIVRKTNLTPKDSLIKKRFSNQPKMDSTKSNSNFDNGETESDSCRISSRKSKEMEGKLKNDSSLHKEIRRTSFSLFATEIVLNENETRSKSAGVKVETESVSCHQILKPNASFLWSKKDDIYSEKRTKSYRIDLPLPVPPEGFVPDLDGRIYDDVPAKNRAETVVSVSVSENGKCENYDDVGIYRKRNAEGENGEKVEKREENDDGKMAEEKWRIEESFPVCREEMENSEYLYDDGEGENYQYVSEGKECRKEKDSDLYQYIQNDGEGNNIYEDVGSMEKERSKGDYEDVGCCTIAEERPTAEDDYDSANCYESVYDVSLGQGYGKGDRSDGSNDSGRHGAYEKSNSLYGMTSVSAIAGDHLRSSMGEESDSTENSGYRVTLFGSACPNSETSQSNSDEWIEVSESESEGTIYLVQERPRKLKSAVGGNSFSPFQKEKRKWKKLQRKSNSNNNSDEVKLQTSDDHFYESVGQYENAEIIEKAAKSLEAEQTNNFIKEEIYSDEQYIDDFDSQSSEDEAYIDVKLPDIPNPNHGYNITKSLKAAGKKLRKNFSLRKNDLSKSLKRFKKSSRPKVTEVLLGNAKGGDSPEKVDRPSTPTNPSYSIYSNNSDSSNSSYKVIKSSNSTSELNNQRHRKSWTFRSKFKSNSTDTSDNNSILDTNRNSTFYLSLNEVQPKKLEKKLELLSEIQTVLSKRSSNSCESVSDNVDKDVGTRNSDSVVTCSTKFRPTVPPPPPPPPATAAAAPLLPLLPLSQAAANKVDASTEKTKYSDILWGEKATNNCLYVESGLFDKQKKHSRCTDSDTSLYAEIGLYAASDELAGRKTQLFVDEPLYQFYTECVNQRARDDILNNYDSEGYEEINDYYSVINEKRRTIDVKNVRPNFEDLDEDARSSKISSFSSISDRRTLWCQIPAVVDSCILQTLTEQARKLQEAKFEIITSEGSYMNSLNVLENHFMKKVNDLNIITKRDFRILFGNIVSVKKCSENFLEDLENCWQNNIMLNGICDIVHKHSTNSFQVYTKYCKNQVCIYRTLRELLDKNMNFESALKEIESDPICQNLNIHSFLMLPMQRITRLPLLMGAVLARMDKTDDEYEVCKASFDVLNKIVQDCDDEARRMERCEEMLILSQQIEFPKDIRRIPIITGSRFLVKSGQVTQLVNRDENKLTFGKKFSKITLTLFLFTDLLIVAKKKNPRNYVVVDHCPRNLVQMQTTEGLTQLPVKFSSNSDSGGKLLMLLTMLENHEKKTVEMILMFEMESDKQRWLEAVTPKFSENPNECIYEEWDCPQVIALYEFTPVQPDELNLCIGDVVNVLKKMADGWYQGERLRDGARGWFPQNHTQEVSSSHIRAKNKKLRYKLLALSGNLIDSQKMNGINEIQWYCSEEVMLPPDFDNFVKNIPTEVISRVDYGNGIEFRLLSAKEAMSLLKKESDREGFLDVLRADEQHSDLLPGKYEGGLKTWECTKDLTVYFVKNIVEKSGCKLQGKSVLDLGCGSGILGIVSLQNGARVTFQDYNKEVLEVMTMVNVFLNCENFKDRVNFYSGDWFSFLNLILHNNENKNISEKEYKYDYILTSETIYNQENYEKLFEIFKKLVKSDGIILLAAKTHYFGVGGTLYEFMNRLKLNGFNCLVVWETMEGVSRKIVKVKAANVFPE